MITFTRRLVRRSLGLIALGLVALAPQTALAQFGMNWRDITRPDFDTRQVDTIAEMLAFDDIQRDMAAELLAAYQADIGRLAEDVSAIMEGARQEFRETRDPSVWQDVMGVVGDLGDKKDGMTQEFMENMQLILTGEQVEQWGRVERYHRRSTSFGEDGLLSGENVDVIMAVESLELSEEQMAVVRPVLDQYELEIDRALIERNRVYEESMEGAMQLWQNQDFEEMEERYEKARDVAKRVRDINRRFARQVEQTLEGESAARMSRTFKEQSFPRVYRRGEVGEMVDTVLEFEDLSVDQLEQVETIRAEYIRRVEGMNDNIAKAIEESELERGVMSLMGRGRGNESDEIRDARTVRREFDDSTMERIRALLTPEQAERLPEEQETNWRDRLNQRRGGERGNRPRRGGEGAGRDRGTGRQV